MLEALPDGKSTASTLMEPNSRLMLPPALAIAARSAAVGAWLYPTSKWSFAGADAAVDAPAISANALTASARRNTFKCLSPPNDSWNGRLFDRRAASYPQRHCREVLTTSRGGEMTEERRTTTEEAKRVGDTIGVDWARFDLEQFRAGMDVEYEHGSH